jgi:uncharacterized membrane protein
MLDRFYHFISSLRLTVALLALGFVLVFWGTLAQVKLGLYQAQNEFFRGFFIYWHPTWTDWKIPIFPGGYLVGSVLLINLFAAHFRYYQPGKRKVGIVLIHLGIVLLLVGQLLTDILSVESTMHLRNGETKNYSEASSRFELAITDTTDPKEDKVVTIPASRFQEGKTIQHPELPFTIRVERFFENSALQEKQAPGYQQVKVSHGLGFDVWWRSLPRVTEMDKRDMPSGILELITPDGSLGTFLVSAYLTRPYIITHGDRLYRIELRLMRFYKPYSIHLLEFRHDRYPGTEIPKNFSSRVRVTHFETGEQREVLIYMNNPLRYEGETYYQASFDRDDQGTVLQVVRNPSWLTPYFACVMVGVGMVWQFLSHLIGFASKQRKS